MCQAAMRTTCWAIILELALGRWERSIWDSKPRDLQAVRFQVKSYSREYDLCPEQRCNSIPPRKLPRLPASGFSGSKMQSPTINLVADSRIRAGGDVKSTCRQCSRLPSCSVSTRCTSSQKRSTRHFRKAGVPAEPMAVTDSVTIDAPRLLRRVIRNIAVYETARECIVSDPTIMGGLPVVKGTRVLARTLHARIKGGDTIESILEEYNYLDRDAVRIRRTFRRSQPCPGPTTAAQIHGACLTSASFACSSTLV